MQAPWTLPSSWTICLTSRLFQMSCWWKIWIWKSVRERMCWWWETQALARRLCWGSSTASGRPTVVSAHQQEVVKIFIELLCVLRICGARPLSPQALSRWPHASGPEEPSSCLRNRIWLTARSVSRSLFSDASELFKLRHELNWRGHLSTGDLPTEEYLPSVRYHTS